MRPFAKLRVLTDANDGAQVFQLLQPVINDPAGRVTGIEPNLARAEAVAVLREAITAGEVFLVDVSWPDQPLSRDEALQAVEQDATWKSPPERILLLNLTPTGERVLNELLQRRDS